MADRATYDIGEKHFVLDSNNESLLWVQNLPLEPGQELRARRITYTPNDGGFKLEDGAKAP